MDELIMKKQHDKQFKENAVKYYLCHKELGVQGRTKNLDIGGSTSSIWISESKFINKILSEFSEHLHVDFIGLPSLNLLKHQDEFKKTLYHFIPQIIYILFYGIQIFIRKFLTKY